MRNKLILLMLSLICSFQATAKPVVFNFERVDLNTFLGATYGEVLKKNVVQSPELLQQGRKVSLRVQIEENQLPAFLSGFLSQMGVSAVDRNGVIYLSPTLLESPAQPSPIAQQVTLPPPPGIPFRGSGVPPLLSEQSIPDQLISRPIAEKKKVSVYSPLARSPEFLCSVVIALTGQGSCTLAGTELVLHADESIMEKALEVLAKVDHPLPRIQLQATFIEVANTGKDGFGLAITANALASTLGVNAGNQVSSGAISLKGTDFSIILDALKTDTRFKQVASPSGSLNSGEHFIITIGDEVPTLGNIQQDNKGNAIQSVVYRPSGVILDILPRAIQSDNSTKIEATIKGQVSNFSATASGVNNSPTLSKREISTVLTFDEGEVVIIGGLTGTRDNHSRSSFLGLIPWGYSDDSQQTELILLLSAKIAK